MPSFGEWLGTWWCRVEFRVYLFTHSLIGALVLLQGAGGGGDEAVSATAAVAAAGGSGGEAAQFGTGTSAATLQLQPVQLQHQHAAQQQQAASSGHAATNTGGYFQKLPAPHSDIIRGGNSNDNHNNKDIGGLYTTSSPQRRPLLGKSGVQSSPALGLGTRGRGDQGGGGAGGEGGPPPSVHYIAGSGRHSCGAPTGPHGTVAPSSSRHTRDSSAITDIGKRNFFCTTVEGYLVDSRTKHRKFRRSSWLQSDSFSTQNSANK